MREGKKRGDEPAPVAHFRMRSSVREKVDAGASSVGLNRGEFFRLATVGALASLSPSPALEKEPLADAS